MYGFTFRLESLCKAIACPACVFMCTSAYGGAVVLLYAMLKLKYSATAKRPSYNFFKSVARRTGPGRARGRELRDDRAVSTGVFDQGYTVRSLSERNSASQNHDVVLDLLYL